MGPSEGAVLSHVHGREIPRSHDRHTFATCLDFTELFPNQL